VRVEPGEWPVLSRLLDAALDLAPERREHWLNSLPAADRTYQEQLRELLRQHSLAATRDFLDTMPKLSSSGAAGESMTATPGLARGAQVGPYLIEEEVGRGGMGAVWRARRSDGVLNRTVALKLPHVGEYGAELVERFAREREILAKLTHPNIARLYDAGFSASGQPYLALEYVPGLTLTQYCDASRLDMRRRLEIFQQVLRAVQYAHSNLVIHRDLKPSNVIVAAEGQAMLLDFGIAKLIGPDATSEPSEVAQNSRTQLGVAPLTPDYASPEQIAREQVTTASDIYSLGVLLFELLTGSRPYRLKRGSRALLEEAILTAEPPRPSQSIAPGVAGQRGTTAKGLAKTLRGDLDTIVLKALKKSPAERYVSADAFFQDIQHYLRHEPVAARPDSGWYRAGKFVARHKLPVAASAAGLAAILAVAGIALFEAGEAGLQRDRALALSSRNAAVTDFLDVLITEAAQAAKPVSVSDMLARSEALANSEYRGDPQDRAAVLGMLGIHYHTRGDDSRSEPLLRQALAAAHTSSDRDLIRQLSCDYAMSLAGRGDVANATATLEKVIADPQTTPQQSAMCLEYLAYIAQDGENAADALKYGYLALQRLSQVKKPSPVTHALFLGSVGYAEHMSGHNAVANRYYEQSLSELERAGRERGPDAVTIRNNWALVSDGAGEPRRSLQLHEQTLGILAQNDPTAPVPAYLQANHARALEALGRLDQARAAYLGCLAEGERTERSSYIAFCLLGLARVSREQGDLAAARGFVDRAAAVIGDRASPGSPMLIAVKTQRGKVALADGRRADAHADLDSAIAEARAPYLTIDTHMARAELYAAEGNVAAAESDARQALQLTREQQGGVPYSDRVGSAWLTLGKVLARKGDETQALVAFEAAVANLSHTVDEQHPLLREARRLAASTTRE
jgi:serine/threonine protein kinase